MHWTKTLKAEEIKERLSIRGKGRRVSPATEFKKGQKSKNWNGFKKGHQGGVRFKFTGGVFQGTQTEYKNLHAWVNKTFGQALECAYCGRDRSDTIIDWANVSQLYTRDLNDWIPLCRKCHFQYDKTLHQRGVHV